MVFLVIESRRVMIKEVYDSVRVGLMYCMIDSRQSSGVIFVV
jgi:hypothetical protein